MSEDTLIQSKTWHGIEPVQTDILPVTEQVEVIKENVNATFSETNLPEKVADLRIMLDNLSEEVVS